MATNSMRGRLTTFAFVLYVALDLSNPFVPGAFNFNPEECVEAAQRAERRDASSAVADPSPHERLRQQSERAQRVIRRLPAPERLTVWRAPLPIVHAVSPPPSSSTEDH